MTTLQQSVIRIFPSVSVQYFARYDEYKADDGPHSLKVNDIVLMKSKENPERVDLIYEVADVVIRDGQIRDPLTGERVLGDLTRIDFEKDMARINNLLPDRGQSQATLHYSPDFMAAGLPQSPRDKS